MSASARGRDRIAAAILAGGKARRYGGVHKGLLALPGGSTIVERLLQAIVAAGIPEVIICTNDAARYEHLGVATVPDVQPGLGPLGGIEAGLRHFEHRFDGVLILPCDMPRITGREIQALTSAFAASAALVVFAQSGKDHMEPLVAVAAPSALPAVRREMARGCRRVRAMWERLGAEVVRFPDSNPFANVNSPEDYLSSVGEGAAAGAPGKDR